MYETYIVPMGGLFRKCRTLNTVEFRPSRIIFKIQSIPDARTYSFSSTHLWTYPPKTHCNSPTIIEFITLWTWERACMALG